MDNFFTQLKKIAKKESGNNLQTIEDIFYYCKNLIEEGDVKVGLQYCKELKKLLGDFIHNETNIHKNEIDEYVFNVLVLESRYSFDSYFQALEFNRPIKEQFYMPRRNTLLKHGVIQALEDLLINDKIDELFLSMPPRVGKTTLAVFVITWLIGYESERTNLYCSNSGVLAQTFYAGVTSILNDEFTYNWHKIFPHTRFDKSCMCNSKDTWLDTGKNKRFHSLTARSIDGSLNGACDCDRLLLGDDFVNGIEEALNLMRLQTLQRKVDSDFLSRAKQRARKWWIGTRWSIYDPIGNRLDSVGKDPRVCNIVIPALDENDHSNFNYLYDVGFDDEYFKSRRRTYEENDDMASWYAIYQGKPIEREGLLFNPNTLKTWNGVLNEGDIERKFAYVDVAWGGGDYVSMPIIYKSNGILYMPDVIFNNGDKKITQPLVANAIVKHGLGSVRFEKNNGGEEYKDDIDIFMIKYGYKVNLSTILAPNQKSKEIKIFEHAPAIRDIYFLEESKRSPEYKKFMECLCQFTIKGKNKKDDAPDSLAGVIDMDNEIIPSLAVEVFKRWF